VKNWVVNHMMKSWREQRAEIQFAKKSFNEQWRKKNR
jgi:hypothetical protein